MISLKSVGNISAFSLITVIPAFVGRQEWFRHQTNDLDKFVKFGLICC